VAELFSILCASQTDVGIRRSHNQDACLTQPATDEAVWSKIGHVFIVADGMGGHAVGEKASAKAVRDIPLTYIKHVVNEGPAQAIERAFIEANTGIYQIGLNNPEFKGLGTTGTALFLRRDGAWIGHVGDTRVYRVRGQLIEQLTFDHSWVWEMARRRGVDPDELGDIRRNVIIRSLGPEALVQVDVEGPHEVLPGDRYLICSDGLTNHVRPEEIGVILAILPPTEACRFLIEWSNLRGGSDNVTCLSVSIPEADSASPNPTPAVRSGGLTKLWHAWRKRISLPVTGLLAGGLLLVGSILWHLASLPGAAILFLLAAGLMIPGLIGYLVQLRRAVEAGSGLHDDHDRVARVYKKHNLQLDESFWKKLGEEIAQAEARAMEAEVTYDLDAVRVHQSRAEQHAQQQRWSDAILERTLALEAIAGPLNKHLHKSEVFRPNWTTRPTGS
jgi:protein phosphatase